MKPLFKKLAAKSAKNKEKKYRLPMLLEFIYNASFIIVAVAGILTAGISLLSGTPILLASVRVVVTVIVVGVLMWLISLIVTNGTLKAINEEYRERLEKEEEEERSNSTIEIDA
jgi:hypothetical protein